MTTFAIMFEAVFILTTLDAGTRVGRFMLQDLLGALWTPLGRTSWYPSVILSSGLVVGAWGYFLYVGVLDPYGGINILWPLFGISNQMLAAIALAVATGALLKTGRARFAWVTGAPLAWLAIVTTAASWEKLASDNPKIGFLSGASDLAAKLAAGVLPPDKAAVAGQLVFNQRLDALLTAFFLCVLWAVILDMLNVAWKIRRGTAAAGSAEVPYQRSTVSGGVPWLSDQALPATRASNSSALRAPCARHSTRF